MATNNHLWSIVGAAAILALFVAPALAGSSGTAANKAAVASSSIDLVSTPMIDGYESKTVSLLKTEIKTSSTMDLLFQVSLECALWTGLSTIGNDLSKAQAQVVVWVEMDGKILATGSVGEVVFCDRMHQQATSSFDDEDAKIEQFLATRTANTFNWVAIDVGSATHTVEVKAQLVAESTSNGVAQAGIGQRTLVVEPIHLASGFTF